MYFDALTISAVADELMDRLVGGRIQDSVDVDEDVIGLEVVRQRAGQRFSGMSTMRS